MAFYLQKKVLKCHENQIKFENSKNLFFTNQFQNPEKCFFPSVWQVVPVDPSMFMYCILLSLTLQGMDDETRCLLPAALTHTCPPDLPPQGVGRAPADARLGAHRVGLTISLNTPHLHQVRGTLHHAGRGGEEQE